MTVGILELDIFIHNSNSLKEKMMILHSLKARLRNSFYVAVTQIYNQDKWQRSTLAVAGVEIDRKNMDSILCRIINFVEDFGGIELINHHKELI